MGRVVLRRSGPSINVDAYSNLALLPKTPTAQRLEAAVNLLEAIEVCKATPEVSSLGWTLWSC